MSFQISNIKSASLYGSKNVLKNDMAERYLNKLFVAMKENNEEEISVCIEGLANLDIRSQNIDHYITELVKYENPDISSLAAWAAGRLGIKEAVPELINMLKNKDDNVFSSAIIALGKIGDERAVNPLLFSLDRKNMYQDQFISIIRSLGEIGSKKALRTLLYISNDKQQPVKIQSAAKSAVDKIKENNK
ncbi:MAG: HEAT repeat domain-containing protein [Armatimonadota bacterium]